MRTEEFELLTVIAEDSRHVAGWLNNAIEVSRILGLPTREENPALDHLNESLKLYDEYKANVRT